ncbi:class I SAM-dependent methyltransferase [Ancylobacter amanitiformis]|uniref:Class I SAM-dependent methyltransferase n=1 Tax=Ancylobacter amanitiformis TaxID=217069 RepID=A0ABU0LWH8_9HYPH|nr:class I SAM-dependent methyltransferase [Ancylobacter amanitiformis]MDQ0513082.1 hypothetical protein [Ancylobacter amanitiformis]
MSLTEGGRYVARNADIIAALVAFNAAQIEAHAATPQGVGWNSANAQTVRFDQVLKVIRRGGADVSLNDVGSGYGALHDYMRATGIAAEYRGFDVTETSMERARALHPQMGSSRFAPMAELSPATYSVASGIFGLRLSFDEARWHAYILDTLDLMDANSREGFSFNMLTAYSDPDRRSGDLYYADPGRYFDLCKRRYARNVALYHDYDLYDFTLVVRKERPARAD